MTPHLLCQLGRRSPVNAATADRTDILFLSVIPRRRRAANLKGEICRYRPPSGSSARCWPGVPQGTRDLRSDPRFPKIEGIEMTTKITRTVLATLALFAAGQCVPRVGPAQADEEQV